MKPEKSWLLPVGVGALILIICVGIWGLKFRSHPAAPPQTPTASSGGASELFSDPMQSLAVASGYKGHVPSRAEVMDKLSKIQPTESEKKIIAQLPINPFAPKILQNMFMALRHLDGIDKVMATSSLVFTLSQMGSWSHQALYHASQVIDDREFVDQKYFFQALSQRMPSENDGLVSARDLARQARAECPTCPSQPKPKRASANP